MKVKVTRTTVLTEEEELTRDNLVDYMGEGFRVSCCLFTERVYTCDLIERLRMIGLEITPIGGWNNES